MVGYQKKPYAWVKKGGRTSSDVRRKMVAGTTRAFGSPLRYIQGPGEFKNMPSYTAVYGKPCFLIDSFLYEKLKLVLETAYQQAGEEFIAISFQGECCEKEISRITALARQQNIDVLIGVGGGKTMDTTKVCADEIHLPIIIAPSSASTDAPVSEIAVLYTEGGEYIGSRKMRKNADLVLVDSEIILSAPRRLFVAGIGDALATWLEARACEQSDSPNYIGGGLRRCKAGMAIAKTCWEILFADAELALLSLDNGVITEAFENVIEANTLLSGLGFLNTGLSTAHGIHSGLTAIPEAHSTLHGEKVAFGVVCQMMIEHLPADEIDQVMRFLVKMGLPVTLGEMKVACTPENVEIIAEKTVAGPLIHHEASVITKDLVCGAIVAADALGRKYLSER